MQDDGNAPYFPAAAQNLHDGLLALNNSHFWTLVGISCFKISPLFVAFARHKPKMKYFKYLNSKVHLLAFPSAEIWLKVQNM